MQGSRNVTFFSFLRREPEICRIEKIGSNVLDRGGDSRLYSIRFGSISPSFYEKGKRSGNVLKSKEVPIPPLGNLRLGRRKSSLSNLIQKIPPRQVDLIPNPFDFALSVAWVGREKGRVVENILAIANRRYILKHLLSYP